MLRREWSAEWRQVPLSRRYFLPPIFFYFKTALNFGLEVLAEILQSTYLVLSIYYQAI